LSKKRRASMKFITDNKERWITGLLLLAVVVTVGIIDNYTLMWIFLGLFYFVGFNEAMKLYKIETNRPYYYASIIWAITYFYPNPTDIFFIMAIFFGGKLAYTKEESRKKLIFLFLYPVTGFLYIFTLYREYGIESMFWLLVIVAMSDVGAFFVGKTIGKTQFSPTSPNKTLEGVVGGVLFATISGTYLAYSMGLTSIYLATAVSLLTSIASIFGDLFESYLKREAGVKDSGNLLPGHGGVLDRVDGYLFGAVIMVILLRVVQ
jgi:phosphatidate cytidylyltransferase